MQFKDFPLSRSYTLVLSNVTCLMQEYWTAGPWLELSSSNCMTTMLPPDKRNLIGRKHTSCSNQQARPLALKYLWQRSHINNSVNKIRSGVSSQIFMFNYTWAIPQTPVELLQICFRESSSQPIALSKRVHDRAFDISIALVLLIRTPQILLQASS